MQCLLHVLNQSSLQFAEKILQGQAIDIDTSQKAVDKFRLEIAKSLLRESGVSFLLNIVSHFMLLFFIHVLSQI